MLLKDIMTKDVVTVTPSTSLKEVCKILKEKRISGVPVVDEGGKIAGIVTITDVLKIVQEVYQWQALEKNAYHMNISELLGKESLNTNAGNIMTKTVYTLDENKNINDVMRLMFTNKIHTIPITREDKIVGIIGKRDLVYVILSNLSR